MCSLCSMVPKLVPFCTFTVEDNTCKPIDVEIDDLGHCGGKITLENFGCKGFCPSAHYVDDALVMDDSSECTCCYPLDEEEEKTDVYSPCVGDRIISYKKITECTCATCKKVIKPGTTSSSDSNSDSESNEDI